MALLRDRDPFTALNRVLDSHHTAAGSIRRSCAIVEDCIASNRDNLRGFFDKCFPNLLKRIFGYDDFEASWLNMVTKAGREEDARALIQLLAPQGKMFNAMLSADADQLIKFIFPAERLPAHTQELLLKVLGRQELERWPQYRGHMWPDPSGRTQVFLNVFEYFMFWTAFYVLRGSRAGMDRNLRGGASGVGGAGGAAYPQTASQPSGPSWGHVSSYVEDIKRMGSTLITGLHGGGNQPLSSHPYFTLLRMYLEYCLPRGSASGTSGQYTSGGGAGASYGQYGGAAAGMSTAGRFGTGGSALTSTRMYRTGPSSEVPLGELVLSVLVEWWLTEVSEPVPEDPPVAAAGAAGSAAGPGTPGAGTPGGVRSGGGASPRPDAGGLGTPGAPAAASSPAPGGIIGAASAGAPTTPGAAAAQQLASSSSSIRVLSYQPPSDELVEALGLLTRYVFLVEPQAVKGAGAQPPKSAQLRGTWLAETPIKTPPLPPARLAVAPAATPLATPSTSPAVQAVSRKLYRFLRRTFVQWPLASGTSLTPIVDLWLSIIAPWSTLPPVNAAAAGGQAGAAGQAGLHHPHLPHLHYPHQQQQPGAQEAGATGRPQSQGSYTAEWRGHVMAHLPFYTTLIPHFVELTFARLAFKGDLAARDLLRVLDVLAASPQLLAEIKDVERAVNRYAQQQSGRRPEGPLPPASASTIPLSPEALQWLLDQAADWEVSAASGAQTSPAMQVDVSYRLFTLDDRSAAHYAAAVLRAAQTQVRPELRAPLAELVLNVLPVRDIPSEVAAPPRAPPPEELTRHFPRAGRWQALQYKGDWLRRPIASNEIAPLVRLTVWASDKINGALGLDVPWTPEEDVTDPPENRIQEVGRWMRRRGYRVSLRFLAEVQTIAWLILLFFVARFFLGALTAAPGGATSSVSAAATSGGAAPQHATVRTHYQQAQPRTHYQRPLAQQRPASDF